MFVLVLFEEDFKDDPGVEPDSSAEWDELGDGDAHKSEENLDPGSWHPIFKPPSGDPKPLSEFDDAYYSAVEKLMSNNLTLTEDGVVEITIGAETSHPAVQSVLGFFWEMGLLRKRSKGKAFLYHHFVAEGGNMQSKMALAYKYTHPDVIRFHNGAEENKEALRKSRGEEDEDFQILEYQAQKGNVVAMYKVGLFYYFGLRGLRGDHFKALLWFLKAAEKGEPRSMELLGEIYDRELSVERKRGTYLISFDDGVVWQEWISSTDRRLLQTIMVSEAVDLLLR
ncbi:hypothetical protein VIGAN_02200600 [Vigna angularis var. angularis]|uniref:Uncharacterized protein n=1 Tax=Vigna angularis var. angularis TaxID=157739 RepID=A0A0S3REX7_PHAAN|nr:hypothetical protein VIGAN_02200600 [Vigna angularis var. angularis]